MNGRGTEGKLSTYSWPLHRASAATMGRKGFRRQNFIHRTLQFSLRRELATVLGRTDYRRWSNRSNFERSWVPRTRRAAELVPDSSHVIEFGAGERELERYLDRSCSYVPSDIVDRGPGTVICDLNERPLPVLGEGTYTTAVLLGVLEYLSDVPEVLDWLTKHVQYLVVSYVCVEINQYSLRGLHQTLHRLRAGWMNNYSEERLRFMFQERGFEQISVESCIGNRLFVFRRAIGGASGSARVS